MIQLHLLWAKNRYSFVGVTDTALVGVIDTAWWEQQIQACYINWALIQPPLLCAQNRYRFIGEIDTALVGVIDTA